MDALFAIGSNGSGQLAIGHAEDVSVPKPAIFHPHQPLSAPVSRVAAGGNHTLLLTAAGELYWAGDPASGACGLGKSLNLPTFQRMILSRPATTSTTNQQEGQQQQQKYALVAATWEASVLVAQGGRAVYTLGTGHKGELGAGEAMVRTPTATRLPDFPPANTSVVDLAACMGHVVAVLDNGDAYAWGNCRKGQAGPAAAGVLHAPTRIEGVDFPVRRAVCCKEATVLFGEPGSGRVRVLAGTDKWNLTSTAPQDGRLPAWTDVGASWGSVYVLLREGGKLLAWGRDDHGQLPPPGLPPLQKVAVGSEHVVALAADGDVLSWGWGEHGNCGPDVDGTDVKGRWNVIASSKFIPPGCSVGAIGAGCATSWISITSTSG